ncbi:MAG: Maf family nucleotide pyrophosphatase [Beggiatoa sp.]|nr:Maf family nucleotide pyrophosphatase [Beggiatoa sp.]
MTVAVAERITRRTDNRSGRPFLYLASRSERRRNLLAQLGISHEALDIEVDEGWDGHEAPCRYVRRLALAKAQAGGSLLGVGPAPVLAADTAVVLDGAILGKPQGPEEALCMLARLSGRCHEVCTAVALWLPRANAPLGPVSSMSRVCFRPLTVSEQRDYVSSGEPFGKAGGYAIQGLAAAFIERLEGSYSGIMGLPLCETATLLYRSGTLK